MPAQRKSIRRHVVGGTARADRMNAAEPAEWDAMVAAETMTGANDVTVHALPHDLLRETLRKYNRLRE